jgi:hypothetical protein
MSASPGDHEFILAMGPVARELLGEPTEDNRAKRELRFGTRGSLCVSLDKGTFYDHEAGEGGGVIDLLRRLRSLDKDSAMAWLRERGHISSAPHNGANRRRIVTTYDYTDATGDPLFQVVRYEPKDFRQRHSDGNGGWIWNMKGVQRVIYRLPDVTAAVADGHTVFVVEGEKAADALTKLGVTATCSPGGAGKWRNEYAAHFKGADVVVLPDNDPQATLPDGTPKRHPDGRPVLPGQDHAADVAESLRNIAASVRVLMLPDLPTKGDVADWIAAGGTREAIESLASAADSAGATTEPPIPPDPDHHDDPQQAEIDRLAALPDLFVRKADLPLVSQQLRDRLTLHPWIFERGKPARLVIYPAEDARPAEVHPFGIDAVVHAAHEVCRPFQVDPRGKRNNVTLPDRVAKLYLALNGRWDLRPLHGICAGVLLEDDGSIHSHEGYHAQSGLWCTRAPKLSVPDRPFKDQAVDALYRLRAAMRTFTFKGSPLVELDDNLVVDIEQPPGMCESAGLNGLLTGVSRASLPLAPGIMINAPAMSGSGAGKGLLARMISAIAFGTPPEAGTAGHDEPELEKRIGTMLMRGDPVILLDNLNNTLLRSPQLESCLTEPLVSVRIFGKLEMQDIRTVALVILTGNGLQVSGDGARRYLYPTIEPPVDNPEQREYRPGYLDDIFARRAELLSDALTIWRWGRQQPDLKRGKPFGSYERWAAWVRDPLLALGCADPVDAITEVRERDPARVNLIALFEAWVAHHGGWVKADELDYQVKWLIDEKTRPASIRKRLNELIGTRLSGYELRGKSEGQGKHRTWTYFVVQSG